MTKKRVLILGYGEMGHAMECLLADKHDLFIWDKFINAGARSVSIEQAVPEADFIIFCLPVNPHREIANQVRPYLSNHCVCLSIAKGLDESGESAAQIFESVFSNKYRYGVLYGPMISEELRAGRFGFANVGCHDYSIFEHVCKLFQHSHLKLEYSEDITGISWAVILKNVYAILFGIADGLELGDNVRGFLAVDALNELGSVVQAMGGQALSTFQWAGLGDLLTTATSESSHHHGIGMQLATGATDELKGEGVHTVAMVKKHGLLDLSLYPLFTLVAAILANPENTETLMLEYINSRQCG